MKKLFPREYILLDLMVRFQINYVGLKDLKSAKRLNKIPA